MTQPSISVPQDNVTKAKTIIEGVTVSVLLYSQFGNLWFVWTIGCNVLLLNFTNHIFPDIETDRSCTDLDMIYTNYRDFWGLEKLS